MLLHPIDSMRIVDEFDMAVDAWNGGGVDNFSMASDNAWTYLLSSSCGPGSDVMALPKNDLFEDLKAESRGGGTFSTYPRWSYFRRATPTVEMNNGCILDYEFLYLNSTVLIHLILVCILPCLHVFVC